VAVSSSEHHCYNTVIVLNIKNVRADLPSSGTSDVLMIGADLPLGFFYRGTQYTNRVINDVMTRDSVADLPYDRKKNHFSSYFTIP
jgi:hypothetical protein